MPLRRNTQYLVPVMYFIYIHVCNVSFFTLFGVVLVFLSLLRPDRAVSVLPSWNIAFGEHWCTELMNG